jgi:subtilisin family serine protease
LADLRTARRIGLVKVNSSSPCHGGALMNKKAGNSQILSRQTLLCFSSLLTALLVVVATPPAKPNEGESSDDFTRPSAEFSTRSTRLERGREIALLGVEPWHRASRLGGGIKVAVLDSGFRGYKKFLGDVLPAKLQVHSFRHDGNLEAKDSQHGILCGEVIHALAPDAEILFANWEPDEPETFLEAVRWARKEGARIATCSVIMPSWSDGDGSGEVHQKLASLLGDGKAVDDMLCFASAGNTAERHWVGESRQGADGFHDWRGGSTSNRVSPWGSDRVSVELYAPAGSARFELSVCDASTGAVIGKAASLTAGDRSTAVVRFEPESSRTYVARVRRLSEGPGRFHLTSLSADLEISTPQSSVAFPADGPEVIGVGAVDVDGRRLAYSSCGPNSTHFKPDMVAPVPFMSFCRSRPFAGTSAAAPQAAGLAAVLWSENKSWVARDINQKLLESASDLGAPGPDFETGYGRIGLPRVEARR